MADLEIESTPIKSACANHVSYHDQSSAGTERTEINGSLQSQKASESESQIQAKEMELEQNKSDEIKRFELRNVPLRKKMILILCITGNLLSGCAASILQPFFPLEGQEKGMGYSMIGFVIGVYYLVVFLSSLVMGNVITRIGLKFAYLSGMFVGGSCTILFGALENVVNETAFLVLCILVRSVEALGFAAFMTASMTIVSIEFEQHVASVTSVLRCAIALGYMVGPALGGVLFDFGGFGFPFYCLGVPVILNVVFTLFVFPAPEHDDDTKTSSTNKKQPSLWTLLTSPIVLVCLLAVFLGRIGMTFYSSSHELYLEPLGLSSTAIGLTIIISTASFSWASPLLGYLTDKMKNSKGSILIIFGYFIQGISYVMVSGVSVLLPFVDYSLPWICVGAVLRGVGVAFLRIAPINGVIEGAIKKGFTKCPQTYAIVSALYNALDALGGFLGPFGGGILVDKFGFANAFVGFGYASFVMCVLMAIFCLLQYYYHCYFYGVVRVPKDGMSSNSYGEAK